MGLRRQRRVERGGGDRGGASAHCRVHPRGSPTVGARHHRRREEALRGQRAIGHGVGHRHRHPEGDRHRCRGEGTVGHRGRALRVLAAALLLAAPGPAAGGAITGRVVFRGEPPSLPPLDVAMDRGACGDRVPSEALVVDRLGGVQWAVVYVEGIPAAPGATAEVTLANRRCRFMPHVLALRAGAELAVLNEDPVLHNLRARIAGQRDVFNIVQPTQGQVSRRAIKRAGVIRLTCDTHPNMSGWILAFEHPYFAVPDAAGSFSMADVPSGTYRLTMWHEGWKAQRVEERGQPSYDDAYVLSQQVVVPAEGAVSAVFELAGR